MNIAYLDCFSGISGDMLLGALLDVGFPRRLLEQQLKKLRLGNYTIKISKDQRNCITGRRLDVAIPHSHHHHRTFSEIKKIILESDLSTGVKQFSIAVFQKLASVESKIHHKKISTVTFHEIGAIDSIIDIVGTAIGIEYLQLSEFYASPLPLSSGFISSQHGPLPLPAPATLELLKGVPVYGTALDTELVTPTGAALLTTLVQSYGPPPSMTLTKVGYGVGSRKLPDRPNLLRLLLGKPSLKYDTNRVAILETNIDDMIPELYDYLMEQLFENGALDVCFAPIQMKKNRPGILLTVICPPEKKTKLIRTILKESTSAGVRYYYADRVTQSREVKKVKTPFGLISVKILKDGDGEWYASPEYEVCKKIAKTRGIPLKKVYQQLFTFFSPHFHPAGVKGK